MTECVGGERVNLENFSIVIILGIGPMGLGGKTTLLAVKIGARPRVPASFFVTVVYLCWAARRREISW